MGHRLALSTVSLSDAASEGKNKWSPVKTLFNVPDDQLSWMSWLSNRVDRTQRLQQVSEVERFGKHGV
jgi:hypothetical protein